MGLFKPDLYRSFAIGFAIGAAMLVAGVSVEALAHRAHASEPAAQAAPIK